MQLARQKSTGSIHFPLSLHGTSGLSRSRDHKSALSRLRTNPVNPVPTLPMQGKRGKDWGCPPAARARARHRRNQPDCRAHIDVLFFGKRGVQPALGLGYLIRPDAACEFNHFIGDFAVLEEAVGLTNALPSCVAQQPVADLALLAAAQKSLPGLVAGGSSFARGLLRPAFFGHCRSGKVGDARQVHRC